MLCHIRAMSKADIAQVTLIDREAFPTMWPPVNFNHELTNRLAHYVVASDGEENPVFPNNDSSIRLVPVRSFLGLKLPFVKKTRSDNHSTAPSEHILGFVGMWIMADEAHIINIAVKASFRGQGVGELLLISSIDTAKKLHAQVVTLEVRASNTVAQNLYTKYGFQKVGIRKNYYTDNKEDALIMTTDNISSQSFVRRFQGLKSTHFAKLWPLEYGIPS